MAATLQFDMKNEAVKTGADLSARRWFLNMEDAARCHGFTQETLRLNHFMAELPTPTLVITHTHPTRKTPAAHTSSTEVTRNLGWGWGGVGGG